MPSFFKKVASSLLITALLIPYSLPLTAHAVGVQPEEKVYFYLQDHLGSVDVIVDEDGNVVERQDYLPYGNERVKTPIDSTHQEDYGFTGKELDEETDLMYYGARYYDPMVGRFASMDPVVMGEARQSKENIENIIRDPQMLNGYTYGANNPLKYVDETGEAWVDWLVGTAYAPAQDGQPNDFASINISNQCRAPASANSFSFGLEVAPGIGDANDVYSAVTGKSAVTDAPLSTSERAFSAIAAPLPIITGGILSKFAKRGGNTIDNVISETMSHKGRFTSKYTLTSDQALDAGEKFLGKDYTEIGNSSSIFRSSDGTRQFRMDSSSLNGNHPPNKPHVHLETLKSTESKSKTINHVIIDD